MLFEIDYDIRVKNYIKNKHHKINVKPWACRWNFRCHLNAVHEAIEAKQNRIAAVVHFENWSSQAIVHFVNVDEDGIFTDNTLWHWCTQSEYYLLEYIDETRFFRIGAILTQYKEFLWEQVPWYIRLFISKYRN